MVRFVHDQTILGVATNNRLYYRSGLDKYWGAAPNFGSGLLGIAVTIDGRLLGIGLDRKLYIRESLDKGWKKLPDRTGVLYGLCVTRDNIVYCIGRDRKIWSHKLDNFAKHSWVRSPDKGGWIKGISVHKCGRIYAVGANDQLFTRENLSAAWRSTPKKNIGVTDCCVTKDCTLIGIGPDKKLWSRGPNLNQPWKRETRRTQFNIISISTHPWTGCPDPSKPQKPIAPPTPPEDDSGNDDATNQPEVDDEELEKP